MILTDRIHPLGYLLAQEINLKELESNTAPIFKLKEGTEVISCSVEILEKSTQAGSIDLGITSDTDFFLNDIDLTQSKTYKSSVETTLKDDTDLTIETTAREGIIKVRLLYFTPGTIYA